MAVKISVIGAGPGGYVAALRAAALGAQVTVIEKEGAGGTCLNWGCIPSKIMKNSADLLKKMAHSETFGLAMEGTIRVDMEKLMARKQAVIKSQQKGIEALFSKASVISLRGQAEIVEKGRLKLTEAHGGQRMIEYDYCIIATGTVPMALSSFPFDGKRIISSNDLLTLTHIPKSIAIVGGGVIGCEFAFILNALGSDVTLIEGRSRILPLDSIEEESSKILTREMKKKKIKVLTNRTLNQTEMGSESVKITLGPSEIAENLKTKEKEPLCLEVETVALCVGRAPNSQGIGLEHTQAKLDDRGWIQVNDRMQTADPTIYAIGDITGPERIMLAHVASAEGMVAAENIMGAEKEMDYTAVPNAIFTMPEVASTGLTLKQAQEKGLNAISHSVLFRAIGKAQVLGEISGQATLVSTKENGRVLGVHIVGPHATDLIAEGTLAIEKGLTATDLAETIHAHPTLAEVMAEVAHKATGNPIHG